ncbi:MAG: hypothetical protein Q4D85_11220 [Corynebacterium sp.]|nr:hypothetical protein [Corynebacterium sp.]
MVSLPGPPPKKNARRRNARPDWVTLPAEGRKGRAPKWPLKGRSPAGWTALWRKPQAVMWERNGDELLVARYLQISNLVQENLSSGKVPTNALAEQRQLEDRLGLSPMAMKRLQWEISEDVSEVKKTSDSGVVIEAGDRFANLI